MEFLIYKIVVHVPSTHTDAVRQAIGEAGGGQISKYSHCTYTVSGTGSYMGSENSLPFNGVPGKLEFPEEDRIEVTVEHDKLKVVCEAIRKVHPYEEPTIDIYPLIDESAL